MRPYVFVYARSDSTRLPGKALMPLAGKTLIDTVLDRASQVDADGYALLTTTRPIDNALAKHVHDRGITVIRGHPTDLVNRTLTAIEQTGATHFLRINGDSPLFSPELANYALPLLKNAELVSNLIVRRFPYGIAVEWASASDYAEFAHDAQPQEREHVTQHLYRHLERLRYISLEQQRDDSHIALAVDTPDDYARIATLIERRSPPTCPYWKLLQLGPPRLLIKPKLHERSKAST